MTNPPNDRTPPPAPRIADPRLASPTDNPASRPGAAVAAAPPVRALPQNFAAASTIRGPGNVDLMAIKRAGVAGLVAGVTRRRAAFAASATDTRAIAGIAVGTAPGRRTSRGKFDPARAAGEPAITLYLRRPMPEAEARAMAASELDVGELKDDRLPVHVVVTGDIHALTCKSLLRPAPNGISVGHATGDTGTAGCLAVGVTPPRDSRLLLISNNHVLARCNAGAYGDPIIQQGSADGGASIPACQIGVLEKFYPLDFANTNNVDAASAWVDPSLVSSWMLNTGPVTGQIYAQFTVPPVAAQVNQQVGKAGRTTDTVPGRINATNAGITVSMPNGQQAVFDNQIEIQDLNAPFADLGDSGSIVWIWGTHVPVGLLFARGTGTTFANHWELVAHALDVRIYP
jgi:hypothetical protein